jgi:polysaccharide export outer membrane protein
LSLTPRLGKKGRFSKVTLRPLMKKYIIPIVLLCLSFSGPAATWSEQAQIQQLVEPGTITAQEAQQAVEALDKGQVSPEALEQLQEQGSLGTLTPADIAAGKRLLEQQQEEATQSAPQPEESLGEVEEEPEVSEDEDFLKKTAVTGRPGLAIFGHALFSRTPSTFAPITSVPVSNDYIIGPGDEIKVLMWGRLDAQYSLEVDTEGVINFPQIGPLTVAGQTYAELKEQISRRAEAITGVNVNVSMGRLRTIQVFVLGEVRSPGVYTVSSLATVANALLASGGPTALGSLRRVELKRQGQIVTSIDLYDFLLRGDTSKDTRLMPGDVIFIPQVGPMVSISGNVNRPAIYELDDHQTLQAALDLAAGLSPQAYNQRIQIERFFENQIQIVLDITYEELKKEKPVPLQDGDLIRVFSILPTSVNAVYLYGNVLRPGQYAFKEGLRLLDIVPDLDALSVDTFFDYALIKRYRPIDMEAELIPFDLGRLLLSQDKTQNIPIQPLDEIYIFSKWTFEDRPTASVTGQVRKPGRYVVDQMRIRDLIQMAGDLKDEAYLPKGELIRTDKDQVQHTLYFDVAGAMADDPDHNLEVRDKDQIIVHSVWEEKWKEVVSIEGEVKNSGEFVLTQGMRMKDLLFKAGGFTRNAYKETGHIYRTDWLTKEVTLHTFNVTKALAEDAEHDLLLQDLDRVVIHSIWEYVQRYNVSIRGMVNKPGDYPHATDMTVKDLILVGGNVKDSAYMDQAELVRFEIVQGKQVQTSVLDFNVRLALEGDPRHNLKLQPLDVIHIKQIPDWGETRRVTLTGEVHFPGTFEIRREERLSSVIERAGGLTDLAYYRGAFFTRESVRKIQQERVNEMIERLRATMARAASDEFQASLSKADLEATQKAVAAQEALIRRMESIQATGRVVIALTPMPVFKGTSSDLVLEQGDALHIPQRPDTVNVLGEVYNPTSLIFDEANPKAKFYLAKTGGAMVTADKKQMYIIRADGTVISKQESSGIRAAWFSGFENTPLYPGDTILVPAQLVYPNWMQDVKDITQILYQIAVGAGVVYQMYR